MYGRRRLTRVEIAVYAVIVGTLVVVFFSYLTDYMEMAEKTAMETTVRNVTAAINLRYAILVMSGEGKRTELWPAQNPFELAQTFPPNYRGLLDKQGEAEPSRPTWLFDAPRGEVVYRPRLSGHLAGGAGDELRFKLEHGSLGDGFKLVPTTPYSWEVSAFAKDSQVSCKVPSTSLFS